MIKQVVNLLLQLGNQASLGICYWSQGLLERSLGNHQAEEQKLSAALEIFTQLGMPHERDHVQNQLAITRRAKPNP